MKSDSEGFWYPEVNKIECIECDLCIKVCSAINKVNIDYEWDTIALGGKNLNKDIQLESSSGGVFTVIASSVINNGGVVFGAAFDEEWNVHHIEVDSIENLKKLRGSKYVQSKIGTTYKQVKQYLISGKQVLFSGTPCQVGGLKSFLRKDYDNLLTIDIICHGVPSPMVWNDYLDKKKADVGDEIYGINFRQKEKGWNLYSMEIKGSKGTHKCNYNEDTFMIGFLRDLYLRPSCYQCKFKSIKRCSDITLADYWSVELIDEELYDFNGTSYVLVHSKLGENTINSLESISLRKTKIDEAVSFNSACIKAVDMPKNRDKFFKDYNSKDFYKNVNDCIKKNILHRICSRCYKRLKSVIKI